MAGDARARSARSRRSRASRSAPTCPAIVERDRLRVRAARRQGDVLVRLDTRQERAQLAAAEAQRELASARPRPRRRRCCDQQIVAAGRLRQRRGRSTSRRTPRSAEIQRHDRAQDDPRAVLRRARHPPGQPRPVPARRRPDRAAAGARPDLRQLRRAAAGGRARCTSGAAVHGDGRRQRRARPHGHDHRDRLRRRRGDAQHPGPGDVRATPTGELRPACSSTAKVMLGASEPVITLPASAINYAPYGNSVFIVERAEGPGRQDATAACASSS